VEKAVKCPKCQTNNPSDSKYCKECATPLPTSGDIDFSHTKTLETARDELSRGTTFAGRYEIIEELGHGGMGKVYKVFDKEIKAKVALKLIKPEVAADKNTIERFRNELRIARDISHKNVCRMYDLGRAAENYFITMEYVPGEDLNSFIRRARRLDVGTAISIAKQVCEGLAEAHRLGVVHRDLKPGNIMIDKDGNAKVMDFGIARTLKAKGITGTGVMIGTPEYMSPEQVEGKEADQRADIYSLGIILYEMVTGRVPFEGDTAFAIALKHKSEEPENPKNLNPQIPDDLSRIILNCLKKDREKRNQNIEELIVELTEIEKQVRTTQRVVPKRKPVTSKEITVTLSLKRHYVPVLILIALAVLISVSFFLIKRHPPAKPLLPKHKQLTFTGNAFRSAISPDGKSIAYETVQEGRNDKLFVQDIATGRSIEVFDAEGTFNFLWTPDGSEIAVNAIKDSISGAYLVSRLGGKPHRISDHYIYAWSPDGSQFASVKNNGLEKCEIIIVNRSTGDSTSLNLGEPIWICNEIDWSPSGDRLLLEMRNKENIQAVWTVWTIKLDGTQKNKIVEGGRKFFPRWSSKGSAIFYYARAKGEDQSGIWKIPISPKTGKGTKSPSLVLPNYGGAHISLTDDGKYLLYTRETSSSNLWLAKIEGSKNSRTVTTQQLTSGTFLHSIPNISPDGRLIAFSRGNSGGSVYNIYLMPIEGGDPTQVTFLNSFNSNPVWSPDGEEIAFGSEERVWKVSAKGGNPYRFNKTYSPRECEIVWAPNPNIIYKKAGYQNYYILNPKTEEETPLFKDEKPDFCIGAYLSPDGKRIAVQAIRVTSDTKELFDIWMISLVDSTQKLIFESKYQVNPIGWSRDGNWLYAYEENLAKENHSNYFKIEVKSGNTQILPTLPFTIEGKTRYKVVNFGPEIINIVQSQSDVWIVENFDPEIK
jgi:serine/threonine protein kinase